MIHSRIARGGMATVYMATDNRLHRTVAIKAMHPHLAEDPDFRHRFEQEARNAAKLTHPNLVGVLDQGEEAGTVYLVMEYLPGITLRDLLKQQRFLTSEQTLEVSESILSGLAAAHHAGIIHRDLKPENVLLADDGRIKLADFGLARPASANTGTGQALLGTIAYLSPELVTRGIADKQSDVYAFGIMMFEMLTGSQPFTGEQPMQIAYQHAHDPVPRPSTLSSESSPALDDLILWATAKEPTERPADAEELLTALLDTLDTAHDLDATSVLGTDAITTALPRTSVLERFTPTPQPPAPPPPAENTAAPEASLGLSQTPRPSTSAAKAHDGERRSRKRGTVLVALTLLAASAAAATGWWFGSGPGSLITLPDLTGVDATEAATVIEDLSLIATTSECTHLTVPAGSVVATEPAPGTRVASGSHVDLCTSIGPKILTTPTKLIGSSLSEAQDLISEAGFLFGEVTAAQFSDDAVDTVLWASTEDGADLPAELPERSVINLVTSAGAVPEVQEISPEAATELLGEAGLEVDAEMGWSEHSETVPKGAVINWYSQSETLYRGDAIGLVVSLGPELFEIPQVAGLPLQEAMNILADAGFEPTTLVPDALRGFAEARETDPAAGEMVPRGTEIRVKSTISL